MSAAEAATAPFNPLSPDAWLAEAYKAVGQDKSQWRWVNGESHLSTWREVGLGMVVYLGTIFGI
ncbi:hypothetical protein GGF44_006188, partial [Coemansia sp. RSA 1694]